MSKTINKPTAQSVNNETRVSSTEPTNSIKKSRYNHKLHAVFGKALLVISVLYVLLYSFIPSNPNYGNHASTCSNVGRDHRILFAIWGVVVCSALIVNILFFLKKYDIKTKFPRVMCWVGAVGMVGFVFFENDKFQKFRLVLTKEQYTGKVTDKVQKFVGSYPRFDILFTKKTIHTTFAIIFGLAIAFAILFCLFYLARKSRKFKLATLVFFGYMLLTALFLGIKLSGLVEAVAVDAAFVMIYLINYVDKLNDNTLINPDFLPAQKNNAN